MKSLNRRNFIKSTALSSAALSSAALSSGVISLAPGTHLRFIG
ncbi:MAG: twin-arginine translocation signal domain-containing protein [Bacteroidota bacterium]